MQEIMLLLKKKNCNWFLFRDCSFNMCITQNSDAIFDNEG